MRKAVLHSRVELVKERLYILSNIGCIRHIVVVDFAKEAAVNELGYHVVRCAYNIVLSRIIFYHRIKFLVGIEVVDYHIIAGSFLKLILKLRVKIISEAVYIYLAFIICCTAFAVAASAARHKTHS